MIRDNRRGETILEVVISISVLMIAMTPASGAIVNSIRHTALNRDSLIAAPLASEGLEVARNFRDGNLLRFSSDKEHCWNMKPDAASQDCEDPNNKIAAGVYRLEMDPSTFNWTLRPAGAALSEKLDSADPADDAFFNLLLGAGASGVNLYNYELGASTNFYREIKIDYLDFTDPAAGGPEWTTGDDAIKITSTVRFRNGTGVQEIKLGEILVKPKPV